MVNLSALSRIAREKYRKRRYRRIFSAYNAILPITTENYLLSISDWVTLVAGDTRLFLFFTSTHFPIQKSLLMVDVQVGMMHFAIIFEDYRDMSTPSASAIPEPDPSIAPWLSHVLVSRKRMHDEPKMQAKKKKSAQQTE